jgi:hypothetical protein
LVTVDLLVSGCARSREEGELPEAWRRCDREQHADDQQNAEHAARQDDERHVEGGGEQGERGGRVTQAWRRSVLNMFKT